MITQRIHGNGGAAVLRWPVWIGIVCENLESQRHFYRDVLGLKELKSGEDFAWFDFDGKLLELLAKTSLPQYDRRRVSFAFEVDDIRSARAELINRGVEAVTEVEGGPQSRNTGPTLRALGEIFLNWSSD